MPFEKKFDDTNRGIAFKNEDKKSDKHPSYRGTLNVEGREYWVSVWPKTTKKGQAISLSIQPKDKENDERSGRVERERQRFVDEELNDDIPF